MLKDSAVFQKYNEYRSYVLGFSVLIGRKGLKSVVFAPMFIKRNAFVLAKNHELKNGVKKNEGNQRRVIGGGGSL